MKSDSVPELIQGIINENAITEEMLEEERKMFRRSDLNIIKQAFSRINKQWSEIYENMFSNPLIRRTIDHSELILFIQALKWIGMESIKAVDNRDLDRLAALKLLNKDVGERLNNLIAGLTTIIDKMQ